MRWIGILVPCAVLVACSDDPAPPTGTAIPVSIDSRGVPRMIQGHALPPAPAATAMQSARTHVERLAQTWGVKPGALPTLDPVGEVRVRGGTIARMTQVIDGMPVYGRELRVLVGPRGELTTASGTLIGTDTARQPKVFVDDAKGAVARAVGHTYSAGFDRTALAARSNGMFAGRAGVPKMEPGGPAPTGVIDVEQARARQVWYPLGDALVAAWVIEAYTSRTHSTNGDAHRTIIAGDGRVLAHDSLVADGAFDYRVFAEPTGEKHPFDSPTVDATPHPTGAPNGSYPAYLAGPSLVTVDGLNHPGGSATPDPWLPADATSTLGNNVDAYADVSSPTGLTAGDFRASANGGVFDHVYNTAQGPLVSQEQQMASVTSLFYVINWLHDFWYDAGFVEAAGNAQEDNYGRGGLDGDRLKAEAQDNALGGSRNNANMSTPDDGMPPRMQVFLWNGKDTRSMTLQPSGRTPLMGGAVFGPTNFNVTANVIVGTDGEGVNPTDGCTPLMNVCNQCSGKLVMVDRGNCTFKTKAVNVQNAGGAGLIVANNTTSTSPPILGDDQNMLMTVITIPSVSVTQAEGDVIKAELLAGTVSATINRVVAPELDGALDATLIAHEFGHYLHHRLSFCNNTMCRALSEGWGDFTALMLLARAGDDLTGAFPFSIYSTQGFTGDPAYFGIRRAPFSTNFAINSLSYRHMADREPLPTTHPFMPSNNNAEVHNAGEVWAAALWEAYVALQLAGPSFDDVRAKMAQYIVAGLLLAPNDATPMETRDAILAAALAASPADHDIMIAAFARRGFGSCAVAPPPSSVDFVGLVESAIVTGNAQLTANVLTDECDADGVLDAGETAHLKIQIANRGHTSLTDLALRVTSAVPGVTIISPPTTLATLDRFTTHDLDIEVSLAPGLTESIAGDLALEIAATGGCTPSVTIPVAFRLNIDDHEGVSTTDGFDTAASIWQPWTAAWQHKRETGLDGVWHGDDLPLSSDTRLTSPPLYGHPTEPVVLTFQHRHEFELSDGIAWDGGVIEISVGTDEVWGDISILANPSYTMVLDNDSSNPLGDRMAYAGKNAAHPAMDTVTLDLGTTALADQLFRIRFRIGTDGATGAEGWDIDDVSFTGIVGTPFPAQLADDGVCLDDVEDPDDPIRSGGGGCCDAGRLGAGNTGLALGLLALMLGRRRRKPSRVVA